MRCRNRIGATAAAMLTAFAVPTAFAALAAFATPAIAADTKYPDFESQWRNPAAAQGDALDPWDPAKPAGRGQQAPLTREYQAIFEASLADQAAGGRGNNYQTSCVLDGMPRIMSLTAPMEILIQPASTILIFENAFARRIYTDGRKWPTDEEPTFEGYSVGKWMDTNGAGRYDMLEVETRQFSGPRALESSGLPLHRDNETIVKERIHLDQRDKDILHDEVTTIDHAFTRPWTVDKVYVRERKPKWSEYLCREATDRIYLGRDEYAVSPDGKLMPVRENQPPPDLRYFKRPQK